MASIAELLASIKAAIYGAEVRTAIHDSIAKCYNDVAASQTLADAAALNADAKAALADTKATLANTAASNADAKAALANTAASNADTKAALADAKAALANTAAGNADTKAALANTAASNAGQAVTDCNTAIYNTEIASANANRAATRADEAAALTEGLSVTSTNVGPDGIAGVVKSVINGHIELAFTLKQGEHGAPFTIKGQSYDTVALLNAGVPNPNVGDMYNVGVEPPYNIHRWTGIEWEPQGAIGVVVEEIAIADINAVFV